MEIPDFIKRLFLAKHIFESVKPLFILTYIFGMTPYYLVKNKHKKYILKTSNFGYFLTCTALALMCSIFANSIVVNESVISYFFKSDITNFADTIQNLFDMSGAAVLYIKTINGKFEILEFMTSMDEADNLVKDIGGIRILYRKVLYFVWLLTAVVLSIVIGYTLMNYFMLRNAQISPTPIYFVTFTLLNAIITILIGHFVCMSTVLQRRFQILNLVSTHSFN